MELLIAYISLGLGLTAFFAKRLLRYMRFFQQEEYSPFYFLRWMFTVRKFDKKGTVVALLSFAAPFFYELSYLIYLFQGIIFALIAFYEPDPRVHGKKKLVMTSRASTIYLVAITVFSLLLSIILITGALITPIVQIIFAQLPPFVIILASLILMPRERAVKNRFKKEAKNKFQKINPYTVGVTGSFGKTSVKNLLGDVLNQSLSPTFFPQKGVNTEMGITREIREKMNEYDKYAVIEMGAYYRGSIKRLCDFTPVNAAIVTAVHLMHLERFGSEEDVYKAKSELPQAVPDDGILVVNGDNAGARKMATEFKKKHTFIYGLDESLGKLDSYLYDVKFSKLGTSFNIRWNDSTYQGFTRMHGKGALSNILASFTMACALGANPETVLAVVREIKPVSNRLEVCTYTDFIQINDAYNSNPIGFSYALEVLRDLPGKRRILITPGMIELGDKQAHENIKLAAEAAKICDLVIVVNDVNKDSLMRGLKNGGMREDRIIYFDTRDQALFYYYKNKKEGDILLLENDLSDVYECEERF